MRILFIGDIMGRPGREAAAREIPMLKEEYGGFDFIIANGENSAGGFGLTEKVMKELFSSGIDILTNGNHVWDKKDFVPLLDSEKAVLRPANHPPVSYTHLFVPAFHSCLSAPPFLKLGWTCRRRP